MMGTKQAQAAAGSDEISAEDRSKDVFFVQLAELAEAMIAKHGKDFAMGTLVLSARFIAEGKPLVKRMGGVSGWIDAARTPVADTPKAKFKI